MTLVKTADGRRVVYRPLAMRVLAVAVERYEGWAAYVDAVPGMKHSEEWEAVSRVGDKLPEEVARLLFPSFRGQPYVS